jgi:hypothetical protein
MSGLTRDQLFHLMRIFYRHEFSDERIYKAFQSETKRMTKTHVCNFTAGVGPNPPTCRECGRVIVPKDMTDSFRALAVNRFPTSDSDRGWVPQIMCPRTDMPCVGWDCLDKGCAEGHPRQDKPGTPQTNAI